MSAPPKLRLTRPTPKESAVLKDCLRALRLHPKVAWVSRINSGAAFNPGGALYRFNDLEKAYGCKMPDIIGQMRPAAGNTAGAFLALEVKRPGEEATPEQRAFLDLVAQHGGLSGVAHSFEEAIGIVEGGR